MIIECDAQLVVFQCLSEIITMFQKKLSDYFRLLVSHQDMLAEFYEASSLMRSDEANLVSALLTSLNVVDCNLCVKVGDLRRQTKI